ncbi:MAG: hypothetical protein JXQ30_14685 [Spirochaetes bacterium]|nr:hypothetical protein [Spirochaetota bacterium]
MVRHGMDMEIRGRPTGGELPGLPGVPYFYGGEVIMDGRMMKEKDTIPPAESVPIIQAVHGG